MRDKAFQATSDTSTSPAAAAAARRAASAAVSPLSRRGWPVASAWRVTSANVAGDAAADVVARVAAQFAQLQRAAGGALGIVAVRRGHAEPGGDADAQAVLEQAAEAFDDLASRGSEALARGLRALGIHFLRGARRLPDDNRDQAEFGLLLDARGRRGRARIVGHRGFVTLPVDRVAQLHRLQLRPRTDLPRQQVAADLELTQRRGVPPLLHVELHQRAVHGLLQRVERQQSQRRFDRALGPAAVGVQREHPRQRVHGPLAQPAAAGHQPVVERRLARVQGLEKLAGVQRRRVLQRFARAIGEKALEFERVDVDTPGRQRDRLAGARGELVVTEVECPAQNEQGLAQAGAGLGLAAVAPQQRGELGAPLRAPGLQREVGEKRLRLPRRQRQRLMVRPEDQQPAKSLDPEPAHRSIIGRSRFDGTLTLPGRPR